MIPKWLAYRMGFAEGVTGKPPTRPPRKAVRYTFQEVYVCPGTGHLHVLRFDATDEDDAAWVEYLDWVNRMQLGQLVRKGQA